MTSDLRNIGPSANPSKRTGEDHASRDRARARTIECGVWTHVEAAKSYLSSRLAQIRIAGMGHGQGEPGVTDCVSVFLSASNAS
jgi:hypothetical protein